MITTYFNSGCGYSTSEYLIFISIYLFMYQCTVFHLFFIAWMLPNFIRDQILLSINWSIFFFVQLKTTVFFSSTHSKHHCPSSTAIFILGPIIYLNLYYLIYIIIICWKTKRAVASVSPNPAGTTFLLFFHIIICGPDTVSEPIIHPAHHYTCQVDIRFHATQMHVVGNRISFLHIKLNILLSKIFIV